MKGKTIVIILNFFIRLRVLFSFNSQFLHILYFWIAYQRKLKILAFCVDSFSSH